MQPLRHSRIDITSAARRTQPPGFKIRLVILLRLQCSAILPALAKHCALKPAVHLTRLPTQFRPSLSVTSNCFLPTTSTIQVPPKDHVSAISSRTSLWGYLVQGMSLGDGQRVSAWDALASGANWALQVDKRRQVLRQCELKWTVARNHLRRSQFPRLTTCFHFTSQHISVTITSFQLQCTTNNIQTTPKILHQATTVPQTLQGVSRIAANGPTALETCGAFPRPLRIDFCFKRTNDSFRHPCR